jgi:hypothetical protein
MADKLLVLVEKHSQLHPLKLEQQAQILCRGKAECKALAHITARSLDKGYILPPLQGVDPHLLAKWVRKLDTVKRIDRKTGEVVIELGLRDACAIDSRHLNAAGKHKGWAGNKNSAHKKSVRDYSNTTNLKALFELPERQLMDAICDMWHRKKRVSSKWVRNRMSLLVQVALKNRELGEDLEKRAPCFKASNGWFWGFVRRHNLAFRAPTTKRAHARPLEVIAPMVRFTGMLRELRATSIREYKEAVARAPNGVLSPELQRKWKHYTRS